MLGYHCLVLICKTLSLKHQLIMNYRLLKEKERKMESDEFQICTGRMKNFDCRDKKFNCIFNNTRSETISSTKWIKFNGTEIEIRTIIMKNGSYGPKFFQVDNIFTNDFGFFIFAEKLTAVLDEHYDAYELLAYKKKYEVIPVEDLQYCFISFAVRNSNGKYYICKKWP